jgi:hypothetical protein
MSGKQLAISGILLTVALGLAGLGFQAMSTNPLFVMPKRMPIVFFIVAGIILFVALVFIARCILSNKNKQREGKKQYSNGTVLLQLIDETYQEISSITGHTIDRLRDLQWQGMGEVFKDVTGINPDSVSDAMQYWTIKGLVQFKSGEEITVDKEADEFSKKIAKEIGSNKDPESLATNLTLSIRHRFLDGQLKKDRAYKNLQQFLRRERDKYPDQAICDAVDLYLEHSFMVNAVWVVAEYDLVGIPAFEKTFEYKILPGPIVLRVEDVPNQAGREMEKYRNKVAVAIDHYLKEKAGRIVHKK